MPCPDKKTLKTYVTHEEYAQIASQAGQARLSVSRYLREVSLGREPKAKTDQEAVLTLIQIKNDLARLGNLFKLAVDMGAVDEKIIEDMCNSIAETMVILKSKVTII